MNSAERYHFDTAYNHGAYTHSFSEHSLLIICLSISNENCNFCFLIMSPDPEGTERFEIFSFKVLEKKANTHAFRHCVLLHMAGL